MKSPHNRSRFFSSLFVPALGVASGLFLILLTAADTPANTEAYARLKGDFHYLLDYRDDLFIGSAELFEMKGLRGETIERIEVKGTVEFTQVQKKVRGRTMTLPNRFTGQGAVSYSIARMSLSRIGEGQVVHLVDGGGTDQIHREMERTYLHINRAARSYSFQITPGDYEPDIDAFGVKVLATTEMKVTRAFIEKMEGVGRPVLFPGVLKEMYPEYTWSPDRDHIVLEAFDIPYTGSMNHLSGSYTDEKGGVLTWEFSAY